MDSRSRYVIDTFRHLYQVPEAVSITFGNVPDQYQAKIHIPNHAGPFFEARDTLDHTNLVYKQWKETRLPFLFEDADSAQIIRRDANQVTINYDIISASFYFLSGWQEYTSKRRDTHGRFPFEQSLQYTLSSPHIPFVNYYFDILKTTVEQTYELELEPRKVDGHQYTLVLSHDIDSVYSGWLQDGYVALKNWKLGQAVEIFVDKLQGKDPWFNIEEILQFEQNHEVSSTFFFLPTQEEQNGIKHADYAIEDPAIKHSMSLIEEAGSEIGLHGDYEAHQSADAMAQSIQQINRPLQGNRFHYLMYNVHKTPGVLASCGLAYDSTLGFSEHIGFRNCYCHPFYLYDLKKNQPTDILEIPLAVMDTTLHHGKYMGLNPSEVPEKTEPMMNEIKTFNGAVSILWHNSYFSEMKFRSWKSVLSDLIRRTQASGGLVTKAEKIIPTYNRSSH